MGRTVSEVWLAEPVQHAIRCPDGRHVRLQRSREAACRRVLDFEGWEVIVYDERTGRWSHIDAT